MALNRSLCASLGRPRGSREPREDDGAGRRFITSLLVVTATRHVQVHGASRAARRDAAATGCNHILVQSVLIPAVLSPAAPTGRRPPLSHVHNVPTNVRTESYSSQLAHAPPLTNKRL